MKVLVYGAGAMGSLVGARLAAEHEVTLLGRGPHVARIREAGLVVSGLSPVRVHLPAVTTLDELAGEPSPDVVVLTIKSYDTEWATRALAGRWPQAIHVSLQNGLGNVEALEGRVERAMAGVTYQGVTFVAPGEVRHAGEGETRLGPARGTTLADAERVAAAFASCGMPAAATPAIDEALWTKAVVNACFNPITGLLRVPSGALGAHPHLLEASELIIDEAVRVAGARGLALDRAAMMERVRAVSLATAANRSSMLQDLERGRPTEIDAINGRLWKMGEERGVACPVNRLLTLLVKAAEAERAKA